MKVCRVCDGLGFVGRDTCNQCQGEGVEGTFTTFVREKSIRKNPSDRDFLERKRKFDKKNASRGLV